MSNYKELQQSVHPHPLGRCILIGIGIAVAVMTVFLIPVMTKLGLQVFIPMATVSVGGALGGGVYHLLDQLRHQGGWKKAMANFLSALAYFILVWFSSIPGFAAVGLWH